MVSVMQTTDLLPPGLERVPDRILERAHLAPGGCWVWTGTQVQGYGRVIQGGPPRPVHRLIYELLVGPIPEGLVLDHLCRNRACCNPDHLEPVTNVENVMRGEGACARNARKTHCPQRHELAGANLYLDPSGKRHCRACRRARNRAGASLPPSKGYRDVAARRASATARISAGGLS